MRAMEGINILGSLDAIELSLVSRLVMPKTQAILAISYYMVDLQIGSH